MPRCSKRTRSGAAELLPGTTALDEHSHKRARPARRHARPDDHSFSAKKCLAWFKEYTTIGEPDVLGPEGMEKFCQDLGVDPENVVMLVIAYKMGAKQMGYFTQEEWTKGLTELQCDNAHKLQNKLEYLRSLLNDPYVFKAIYRYSYDFARVSKPSDPRGPLRLTNQQTRPPALPGQGPALARHRHGARAAGRAAAALAAATSARGLPGPRPPLPRRQPRPVVQHPRVQPHRGRAAGRLRCRRRLARDAGRVCGVAARRTRAARPPQLRTGRGETRTHTHTHALTQTHSPQSYALTRSHTLTRTSHTLQTHTHTHTHKHTHHNHTHYTYTH